MARFATGALCTILLTLGISCAYSRRGASSAPYVPTFDFAPPATAAPASAGVSLAIVDASYGSSEAWMTLAPFNGVPRQLGQDFQELLIARGFTTRGPFHVADEMTFPDRQSTDLILLSRLDITLNTTVASKEQFNIVGGNTMTLSGQLTVGGRVTIGLHESLSNERMWFKSIEVRRTPVTWLGTRVFAAGPVPQVDPNALINSDPGFANAVAKELEAIYLEVMQAAWNYLDPGEVQIVKQQSQEVRSRWVATRR
jgi:hypothetical protein